MNLSSNSGGATVPYIRIEGDSLDGHPHGGHDLAPPPLLNRRVQVRSTDHPSTDRWVVLRTVRLVPTPLFEVGVLDGFNRHVEPRKTYPTANRARRAANRLLTETENDE